MRKLIIYSCSLLMGVSILSGCSTNPMKTDSGHTENSTVFTKDSIVGSWNGIGHAMKMSEDYDASFLKLTVEDDQTFSVEEIGTEGSVMTGKIDHIENNAFNLEVEKVNSDDIQGWEEIQEKTSLHGEVLNRDLIAVSYNDICYTFEKSGLDSPNDSLLDYTVSDLWYSNDGSNHTEGTYELSINDTSIDFYEINKNQEPSLLTTFVYKSNKDNLFSLYTVKTKDTTFPAIFDSLPEGFSSIDVLMDVNDNELTLGYKGQEMKFYSNLIYGLETGSDAYTLCDTSFTWNFDNENHFCYFTMNPDTDTLYLYMSESEDNTYDSSCVCGEVVLNQDKHVMTFHFDEEQSGMNTSSDNPIYKKCQGLDGKNIPYTINDKELTLTIDGKSFLFNLSDY